MKKYIVIRLGVLISIITLVLMAFVALLQFRIATESFMTEANEQILLIDDILTDNDEYIMELQEELKSDYLIRASAVAYITQNNPEIIDSRNELMNVAELLQVDEIHFFDPDGVIYAGTVPEYIGVDMYSGEQIGFFLPLLTDYDLRLAQDVTPNTAEAREMQYVAVWSDDHERIVQIGIEPTRLIDAMAETELDYIFSRLAPTTGVSIFAIDPESGAILSSTDTALNGSHVDEILLSHTEMVNLNDGNIATLVNGVSGQGVFEHSNDIILGVTKSNSSIYDNASDGMLLVIVSGILLGAITIALIYFMLDNVVLNGLAGISNGMKRIVGGEFDYQLDVKGLPEFEQLSDNVNTMVKSVIESSGRFSTVFQHINIPLAIYECHADSVVITSRMEEILDHPDYLKSGRSIDPFEFTTNIKNIMSKPYRSEEDVYQYERENKVKYLKIKIYSEESREWGMVMDLTREMREKQNMKFERDIDFLTNIYNRRAFLEKLNALSETPDVLKKTAVVMMDLDNLKYVNDTWGHVYGDKFICAAADVLVDFKHKNKLAARLSGDEFVILIYGADSLEELEAHIKRLAEDFKKACIYDPNGTCFPITISGGYAFYPDHSKEFTEILHLADQTMYEVKKSTKGAFKGYSE